MIGVNSMQIESFSSVPIVAIYGTRKRKRMRMETWKELKGLKRAYPRKRHQPRSTKSNRELVDAVIRLAFTYDLSVDEIVTRLEMNDVNIMQALYHEIQVGKTMQGNVVYSSGWQAL